jgi:hypothetical protein
MRKHRWLDDVIPIVLIILSITIVRDHPHDGWGAWLQGTIAGLMASILITRRLP